MTKNFIITDSNYKDIRDVTYVRGSSIDDCVQFEPNNWFDILYNFSLKTTYEELLEECDNGSININSARINLCRINKTNAAIWLTTKGDVEYRLTIDEKIETSSIHKINLLMTYYCGTKITITDKNIDEKLKERNEYIPIFNLLLVGGEKFEPYEKKEFFIPNQVENNTKILGFHNHIQNRQVTYINSFKPSEYLRLPPKLEDNNKSSIILQYIYYLSNYEQARFDYILNWLASFFKDLQNKSPITIVLIGTLSSGKEILFDEIITPLFGNEYTIKITDYNLDTSNHNILIKQRLFYNLHNLSSNTVSKGKNKDFIKNLLSENRMFTESSKKSIDEIKLYGQTLITTDNDNMTYLEGNLHNCTVFKVPDNIESMYLNQNLKQGQGNKSIKEFIREDLSNFAQILKCHAIDKKQLYEVFAEDDKNSMQLSLESKLINFHNIILSGISDNLHKIENINNDLYKDLKLDFGENRIKQKNIYKYFICFYPEENLRSPKFLMTYLRKIDAQTYAKDSIINGKSGLKYFHIACLGGK